VNGYKQEATDRARCLVPAGCCWLERSDCALAGSFVGKLGFLQLHRMAHPAQLGKPGIVLSPPTLVFDFIEDFPARKRDTVNEFGTRST